MEEPWFARLRNSFGRCSADVFSCLDAPIDEVPLVQQRTRFVAVVAAIFATMLMTGTASAADPNNSTEPQRVEIRTDRPDKPGQDKGGPDVTIQAAFCAATSVAVKVNTNTVGSQGFGSCSGNVLVMKITVWLEWCDADVFGICFHWTTIRSYGTCSRFGPGALTCPNVGTFNARPGPGKYRTKIFAEVQDTAGGYASSNAYSGEVILN